MSFVYFCILNLMKLSMGPQHFCLMVVCVILTHICLLVRQSVLASLLMLAGCWLIVCVFSVLLLYTVIYRTYRVSFDSFLCSPLSHSVLLFLSFSLFFPLTRMNRYLSGGASLLLKTDVSEWSVCNRLLAAGAFLIRSYDALVLTVSRDSASSIKPDQSERKRE